MKVKGSGKLCIVGCLHGDERFGKRLIDAVSSDPTLSIRTRTILANEEAMAADSRFIDTDLNRSFNKPGIVGVEAELAPRIMLAAAGSTWAYDIHTTYSADFKSIQIVTSLSKGVRQLLSHFNEEVVALIKAGEAPHSFIGNHPAGVSLEFGRAYAESGESLSSCLDAIRSAAAGGYGQYTHKRIFEIDQLIPSDAPRLPRNFQNGDYSEAHGGYVIMPAPTKDISNYQGFLAKNSYEINIAQDK